ncbi:hypothetical protein H4R33_005904 [Dimargaris cristalligena]|nr:hypothetical protein H4R33_005904 [Dimargaris cristalligena]
MSKPRSDTTASSFIDSLPSIFRERTRTTIGTPTTTSSPADTVHRWLSNRSRTASVDDLSVRARTRTVSGTSHYWDTLISQRGGGGGTLATAAAAVAATAGEGGSGRVGGHGAGMPGHGHSVTAPTSSQGGGGPLSPDINNPHQFHTTQVQEATFKLANNIEHVVQGELSAVTEDLRLIEKINIVTQDKYEGLSATVQDMMVTSSKIQQAYSEMEEYMDQADTVCQQIQDLEDMAKQLEACSRQLEIKFRRFD